METHRYRKRLSSLYSRRNCNSFASTRSSSPCACCGSSEGPSAVVTNARSNSFITVFFKCCFAKLFAGRSLISTAALIASCFSNQFPTSIYRRLMKRLEKGYQI